MRVLGLTGGIGTGKSAVARMFEEAGIPVVDADLIAREIVEPGRPAHSEFVDRFGPEYLLPDGRLDRAKVGYLVFSDPARRRELEEITHNRIRSEIDERLQSLKKSGCPLAIVEAALIHENRRKSRFEAVICVSCEWREQIRRIVSRDHLTEEEALKRLRAQMGTEEKAKLSDYVIDNSGTPDATRRQVRELLDRLLPDRSNRDRISSS